METDGDQRNHCNLPFPSQVNSPHDDDDDDDGDADDEFDDDDDDDEEEEEDEDDDDIDYDDDEVEYEEEVEDGDNYYHLPNTKIVIIINFRKIIAIHCFRQTP